MRDLEDCLPFIQHMRSEHQRLHRVLRDVHHTLSQPAAKDSREWLAAAAQQLSTLHTELARHFAAEDAGGCLEEAVSHCPSAAQLADELERQHPELLALVERLQSLAQTAPPTADAQHKLQLAFEEFAAKLSAHEAGERHVMEQGFSVSLQENGDE